MKTATGTDAIFFLQRQVEILQYPKAGRTQVRSNEVESSVENLRITAKLVDQKPTHQRRVGRLGQRQHL
jgi:hypothetical protein